MEAGQDEGLLENRRWWAPGQALPQKVGGGAALIPTYTEGPGIQALETRNFRSECSFLPFLLVGRVLELSITILELLGGKFQAGTPSMEGAELSRTGVKLGDALENQWERRKLRVLGNPTTAFLFHLPGSYVCLQGLSSLPKL